MSGDPLFAPPKWGERGNFDFTVGARRVSLMRARHGAPISKSAAGGRETYAYRISSAVEGDWRWRSRRGGQANRWRISADLGCFIRRMQKTAANSGAQSEVSARTCQVLTRTQRE